MAAGVFIIQELRRVGGVLMASQDPDGGARFEWTSDARAVNTANGGARAAPLQPWDIGGALQTSKTWYGGSKTPSEQVLGPRLKDQTFHGSLDDRYNYPGYALETKRRFEAMCERGNFVRVSFQQEAWEGIITEWSLQYRRAWDIPYAFTLSVHGRPEDREISDRSPPTALSTTQVFDSVDTEIQELLDLNNGMPPAQLVGSTADDTIAALSTITVDRDALAETLDGNDYRGAKRPYQQIATKLRLIHSGASALLDLLAEVRGDTEVVALTTMNMLDFEAWSRGLRYQARVIMGQARKAAQEVEERDEPKAERMYRPRVGELLYAVSQRFYGTPHAWQLIADRNRIRYFKLLGTELLMIPERSE